MRERSLGLPPQDSFILAGHSVNVLTAYRRWGGTSDDLFTAFVGLVAARNKQIAAECLTAIEDAILALDEPAIGSS
jgi:hypothetical protein